MVKWWQGARRVAALALGFAAAASLWGCAHSARGLVRAEEGAAVVETLEGQQWRLRPGEEASVVARLDGCEVEVEGRGGRRGLRVESWTVLVGPGGGQPFVGRLGAGPGGLLLDDRNTGQVLALEPAGSEPLVAHLGGLVLVTGYVSGPQRVQVIDWRSLDP